ncbi:MAG: exodeoxyribonuclease VII small subunit [Dehalococcoidia bacterium]
MAKEPKAETFEHLYARLEESVGKLEQGGLTLEQAIALYEEGMTLARRCQDMLDAAEQKITKLKESFAPVPERLNGRTIGDEVAGYEYVPEEDAEPPADGPSE